jgi:hypothetical protein
MEITQRKTWRMMLRAGAPVMRLPSAQEVAVQKAEVSAVGVL